VASEGPVRVVTDGSVAISPQSIARLNIGVVPCQVIAGRQAMTSSHEAPLAQLDGQLRGRGGVKIVPPTHADFLRVYRALPETPVISIHGAFELGEFAKAARLARNLLPLRSQVVLFEAPTVGRGLSFLVETAAQAAGRGGSQQTVRLMLERIRAEGLRTIILSRSPDRLLTRAGVRGWLPWLLPLIPGYESLFAVDPASARPRLVEQGFGLGNSLARRGELFQGLGQACDATIVQAGYDRLAHALATQLPGLLGGPQAQVQVQPGGLDMTPYVAGRYLAILIYPTAQAVEQIERFARRMVRVFAK
jgi:hypothetical protein